MVKIKKIFSLVLLTGLFLCTVYSTAYSASYILSGSGHDTANIDINAEYVTNYYQYLSNALLNWNMACPLKVKLKINNNNSDHIVSEWNVSDSWYGVTIKSNFNSSGRCTSFHITINLSTTTSATAESVITHEFGHVLNLDENDIIIAPNHSIMNKYRDRSTLKKPTSIDISGVYASY